MALWKVNGEVVYSDGALSITDTELNTWVKRHYYKVPYSNVGKGGIVKFEDRTYHTPSWTLVHPQTSLEDILVDKKPFQEVFVEEKVWKFKSASSDKEYTVKRKKDGSLYCDCWGYIGHKKCKHIKEVQNG